MFLSVVVVADVIENIQPLHHFQCGFRKVDFRIVYDDDVYGARIIAEGPSAEGDDEYNVVCNHLIGDTFNFSMWCIKILTFHSY